MNSSQAAPAAVLMAAGRSTRMKSELPKVLHELCGQPILEHVLRAVHQAGIERKVVVVGHGGDQVRARFADFPGIEFVEQAEQRGTGHAVRMCQELLANHAGPVVVIAGDQPMLRPELIRRMVERFEETKAKAYLATAVVADPTGLGRVIRAADGTFDRIVEQKDARPEEAAIREINFSFYCFDGPLLFEALAAVRPNNAQGEYYVTDVPGLLKARGERVVAEPIADEADILGINHRRHLADCHAAMQDRIQRRLLDSGVTIVDPRSTYIDARAQIGRDSVIHPFTVITGPVRMGERCRIGPFAHVREGTELGDDVEIGAFVEVVRSQLGHRSQARHLAYVGDSLVGERVNVGAGVITANFDGVRKAQTQIEDGAFLGSGAVLIAPVRIGSEAVVGAGAVLTKNHDVLPGEQVVGMPARPLHRKKQ